MLNQLVVDVLLANNDLNAPQGATFVGGTTLTAPTTSGVNRVAVPTGTLFGDLLLVVMGQDNLSAGGWVAPNYFTTLISDASNADAIDYFLAYKFSEGEPYVDIDLPDNNVATILASFRGVDSQTPIDAVAAAISTNATLDPNPPSVTTITHNALVVAIGWQDDDAVTSVTAPTNYGNRIFATGGGAAGNDCCAMIASRLIATPAAEDPGAFTTDGDDACVGYTIALRAAA